MLEVAYPVDKKFKIISPFGGPPRHLEIDGKEEVQAIPHQGIDFGCPLNTPVYAIADGVVIKAGYQSDVNHDIGLGLRIMQEFVFEGEKYIVCYGHNTTLLVNAGDKVKLGEQIAFSGQTGHAEGPHVHVQFRKLDTGTWLDARFV